MTDLKWIEKSRTFPEICREQTSYFEQPEKQSPIYWYAVSSLPSFRKLLEERLGESFTAAERLEIAKLTFRNKPVPAERPAPEDREIADFIYQL